jgi:alpha-1,3-mannosyltransferase
MEHVVAALCRHLRARGHDCGVVTLDRLWSDRGRRLAAEDVVEGVRVIRVPFVGGRRLFIARRLLAAVVGYDVVHIHGVDFFLDYLAFTARKHRRPLVVSTHGGYFHTTWAWPLKHLYFHSVTRAALRRATRVLCVGRRDLRRFGRIVPGNRIEVLGNGVEAIFGRIRNTPTPGLIVSVGRLATNKRYDRLLEAFALVRQRAPEARLLLVGPDAEGLLPALTDRARRLGVSDYVVFAGALQSPALCEVLARAHVFVTASSYEAFGIAAVEAMSAGVVVVASDIDAFREVIVPGENGFLVDFENIRTAAETVLMAMRLPEVDRLRIGEKARRTAAAFSWDRVVDRMERVYLEALGR